MFVYTIIYLGLHVAALTFSEPEDKLACIISTLAVLPLVGRILGWW